MRAFVTNATWQSRCERLNGERSGSGDGQRKQIVIVFTAQRVIATTTPLVAAVLLLPIARQQDPQACDAICWPRTRLAFPVPSLLIPRNLQPLSRHAADTSSRAFTQVGRLTVSCRRFHQRVLRLAI